MSNIFLKRSQSHNTFSWDSIGDIKEGRGDLGEYMPVLVYQLMQYTILDVLTDALGEYEANEIFRKAGYLAGTAFAENMLDLEVDFSTFMAGLQKTLQENELGILCVDDENSNTDNIILTVGQLLDCSGKRITDESVHSYDEGFIAGILKTYTGKTYTVQEIDRWVNDDGLCRFKGTMPVLIYRLMQYTLLDVLTNALGEEEANDYFRKAGFLAGKGFAENMLNLEVDFNNFIASLQKALQEYKIGILRMEDFDADTGSIVLTVGQDLDCSGLPITNETVCTYDEGFIAGILKEYTGKDYTVQETDCWANGDRQCRFRGTVAAM